MLNASVKMNVNRVHESEEGKLLLAVSLWTLQFIVGENAIINAFRGGTSFVDFLPRVGIARDRRQETKVVGEADIDDFTVRRLIAVSVIRAVMNLFRDKRATIFDPKPLGIIAPIGHIVSVGTNRRTAAG